MPETLARLPRLARPRPGERVLALVDALDAPRRRTAHTTNLVVVDRDGNACVLTTSLGLGSGDFLPGLDLHLNSMLGEADLLVGPLEPGERMESMMAPTVALDDDGLALAVGAAGGTRLRTRARAGRRRGSSTRASAPQAAVDRPRFHPAGRRRPRRARRRRGRRSRALEAARLRRSGAGRRCTTTSAASASSRRTGAARRSAAERRRAARPR